MPLYEVFATNEDLAEYLNIEVNNIPPDSERLLQRASELVKQTTLNNIDIYNIKHLEAAKFAVCAQIEYWIYAGENISIIGNVASYSLDDLSMNFGDNIIQQGSLCKRAIAYLNHQGLLYRGL